MKYTCVKCKEKTVEMDGRLCVCCKTKDPLLAADHDALSRMLASEVWTAFSGADAVVVRTWTAYCAINEANRRGIALAKLLMPDGKPGGQLGKYASTVLNPRPIDLLIAWEVLHGDSDPTGGATNFDCPMAQEAAVKRNAEGYTKTPEQVAAIRRKNGFEVVLVPGVPEYRWRLWRKKRKAQ